MARERERELGKSVLAAGHEDYDGDTFFNSISPEVNVIVRLRFEPVYFEVAVSLSPFTPH